MNFSITQLELSCGRMIMHDRIEGLWIVTPSLIRVCPSSRYRARYSLSICTSSFCNNEVTKEGSIYIFIYRISMDAVLFVKRTVHFHSYLRYKYCTWRGGSESREIFGRCRRGVLRRRMRNILAQSSLLTVLTISFPHPLCIWCISLVTVSSSSTRYQWIAANPLYLLPPGGC